MRIGFTYDLRSAWKADGYSDDETGELDYPDTIDGITASLQRLGFEVEPIGRLPQLAEALVAGRRWPLVFNIAEGMHGLAREAQVPALLDAWRIPYTFSGPLVLALTLHKGLTKAVVRQAGVPTADFQVLSQLETLSQLTLPYPLFVKPVAEGSGKGIGPWSKVLDTGSLRESCSFLLERFQQPVLVERWLSGREFTVGILGNGPDARVFGIMEVHFGARAELDAYTKLNKDEYEARVWYQPVTDAEALRAGEVALQAWRALECRDGGRIDVRSNERGEPQFIEVNPLAGLRPVHSDMVILARQVGWSYDRLLAGILEATLRRLELPLPPALRACLDAPMPAPTGG